MQEKVEEILSVMREIQELSTEHRALNTIETTETSQPLDNKEFNQLLGRWQYRENYPMI